MPDTNDTIDGLLAEFRGYAAGMPPSYHVTMSWHDFRRMLDRFEAAHRRERGDAAKLREALEMVRDAHYTKEVGGELYEGFNVEVDDGTGRPLICVVKDALAAPLRNCERFASAEEADAAYRRFCEREVAKIPLDAVDYSKERAKIPTKDKWLFAPATEKEGGGR